MSSAMVSKQLLRSSSWNGSNVAGRGLHSGADSFGSGRSTSSVGWCMRAPAPCGPCGLSDAVRPGLAKEAIGTRMIALPGRGHLRPAMCQTVLSMSHIGVRRDRRNVHVSTRQRIENGLRGGCQGSGPDRGPALASAHARRSQPQARGGRTCRLVSGRGGTGAARSRRSERLSRIAREGGGKLASQACGSGGSCG